MKKLWVNIGIFFGCFLLLITCIGAVLVMAPGMELLGIMYIRKSSGSVESKQTLPDASQYDNIYVESDNIPVQIEFVQSTSLRVELLEYYDGFAKASEEPSVEIIHKGDTIEIKSSEYTPFIAHKRSEESCLKVKVPMYYTNNLEVVSRKSEVRICGLSAAVNDISIETGGQVKFDSDIKMHALNITLQNEDAVIADWVVMDGNIHATSKGGNLTVPKGFKGRLEFSSNSGDLILSQCAQLTFKSKTGALKGKEDELPYIQGDVLIETGGKIEIGRIGGAGTIIASNRSVSIGQKDEICGARLEVSSTLGEINLIGSFINKDSKIKTKYGDVSIQDIDFANVESTMGDVSIWCAVQGNITTRSGKVNISKVKECIDVETKSGKVYIGSKDDVIKDANIKTKSGNITILNAGNSNINIKTESGDVQFTQSIDYKANLKIEANKSNVVLNGITGETYVATNRKITANVHDVNETIELIGKNKKVDVHIRKTCYVDIKSESNIVSAPGLTGEKKEYRNAPKTETKQIIKIKTEKGKVSVIVD